MCVCVYIYFKTWPELVSSTNNNKMGELYI
jgi:hypothetical protein